MNPDLLVLYNNIRAKDPSILGDLTPDGFAATVPDRDALDNFLGQLEVNHPDILEKYSQQVGQAPTLIQDDLQAEMRKSLAPVKTAKRSTEQILNSVFPVDKSIAEAEKARRQEALNQKREQEQTDRNNMMLSGSMDAFFQGAKQTIGSWLDPVAEEDKQSAIVTLGEDTSIPTDQLTHDLAYDFVNPYGSKENARKTDLFRTNRQAIESGGGEGTDLWGNLTVQRIHELQKYGMSLDNIMQASAIEGYTPEQHLKMKQLIGAEQYADAQDEIEKLKVFDEVLSVRESKIPQETKDRVFRLNELSSLGENITPEQIQEGIQLQQQLEQDPNFEEYQKIANAFQKGQDRYNSIKERYPEAVLIDELNESIQSKANDTESFDAKAKKALLTVLSGSTGLFGPAVLEAPSRLLTSLDKTVDTGLAALGNDEAQLRMDLRTQDLKRDGAWRDAEVANRPINERVAEFQDESGKKYTVAFSDNGRATDIYDETGNRANIDDATKLAFLNQAESSGLNTTAKRKFNSDALTNQINDGVSDFIGTLGLMAATSGMGSGPALDRVRTALSIYAQYAGQFTEEGLSQGLNPKDATNRAMLLSAVEAGSEMMFNVFGRVLDPIQIKGTKDALQRVLAEGNPAEIKRLANREFRRGILGIPGEGGEEIASAVANPFVNATFNNVAGTDLDQELPSGLDLLEAGALGAIIAGVPAYVGAARSKAAIRGDQHYKESIYALAKDINKTKQAVDLVGQGQDILPIVESTAQKARVDLADKNLTEQQKIDRVSAIFNSEAAKARQGELLGTPREGEVDGLVEDTDLELKDAYNQQEVADAISAGVVQNNTKEGTDSTGTGGNVNSDTTLPVAVVAPPVVTELIMPEVMPTLPKALAGAKPSYNYGNKSFTVQFDNDIDRAAYIVGNAKTKSKQHDAYLAFVMEHTGMTEEEAIAYGTEVRAKIKEQATTAPAGVLNVPQIFQGKKTPISPVQETPKTLTATPKNRQGYVDIIKAVIPQLEGQQVEDLANIAEVQVKTLVDRYGLSEQEAWAKVKGKITTDYARLQGEILNQSPKEPSISQQYNEGEIDEAELLDSVRDNPQVQDLVPQLEQAISQGDTRAASLIGQQIADTLAKTETSGPSSVFPTPELEQQFKDQVNETIRTQQIRRGAESQDLTDSGRGQETSEILRGSHQAARSLGLESPRELEEIALKEWAVANGVWHEDLEAELGNRFLDRGIESRVYVGPDGNTVIKGNDGKSYASWAEALEGFALSSNVFPAEALTVQGFGIVTDINGNKVFGVVLEQPRVNKARVAEVEEIEADMTKRGFEKDGNNDWYNPTNLFFIHDLHQKNVLVDEKGDLRYIDTRVYDSESELDIRGYYPNINNEEGIRTERVRQGTEQAGIGVNQESDSNNLRGSTEATSSGGLGVPEQDRQGRDQISDSSGVLQQDERLLAPNGEPSNLTPEQYAQVRTPEFKAWFGDWEGDPENASKVVDENGEPLVVYHGTTNDFNIFDPSVKGNIEGHFGKVNYFTTDENDAEQNYLSSGADLTGRINRLQEEIENELDTGLSTVSISELKKRYGITTEELKELYPSGVPKRVPPSEVSYFLATKKLHGGNDTVISVFINSRNPVKVGGRDSSVIDITDYIGGFDALMDEQAQEYAEEKDMTKEEALDDYSFEVRQRVLGDTHPLLDALETALNKNGYEHLSAADILGDNLYEDEVNADDIEKSIRSGVQYENNEGEIAGSQVVADFFKELGFDSIVLLTPHARFQNMGIEAGTQHIHVFDITPQNIKSATDNSGAFDPNNPNILQQDTRGAATRTGTYFSNQADVSTPIHEDHHHFLDIIDELAAEGNEQAIADKAVVDEFAASEEGKKFWARKRAEGKEWARKRFNKNNYTFRQELFAESAEKYFSEGAKAGFSDKVNEMFERFKTWLQDLYKNILNSPLAIELSPKMRSLFDSIYGAEKVNKDITKHNRENDPNLGVNDYVFAPQVVDNGLGVPPALQAPDRAKVLERLRDKVKTGELTDAQAVVNGNPEGYEGVGLNVQLVGQVINEPMAPVFVPSTGWMKDDTVDDTEQETAFLNEFREFTFVLKQQETHVSALAKRSEGDLPAEAFERETADYYATATKMADLISRVYTDLGVDKANAFFIKNIGNRQIPLEAQVVMISHFVNRPGMMRRDFRPMLKALEVSIDERAGRALGYINFGRVLGAEDTITAQERSFARQLLDFNSHIRLQEAESVLIDEQGMNLDASDSVLLEMDQPTSYNVVYDTEIKDTGNVKVDKEAHAIAQETMVDGLKTKYGENYLQAMIDIINETAKRC